MGMFDIFNRFKNTDNKTYLDNDDLDNINDINDIYDFDKLKSLLDKDLSLFGKIKYPSRDLIIYAKEKGFVFTPEFLSNHCYFKNLFLTLLDYDISCINYYAGEDIAVYSKAIEKGYKFSKDNLDRIYEDKILKYIIDYDKDYFSYLSNPSAEIIRYAMEKGFDFNQDYLSKNSCSDTLFLVLLDYSYSYIDYYNGNDADVFIKAAKNGYNITFEDIKCISIGDLKKVLDFDVNYFSYFDYFNEDLIRTAKEKGFVFTPEFLDANSYRDELFLTLLDYDISCMDFYSGFDINVMLKANKLGYKLTPNQISRASHNSEFYRILDINFNYIKELSYVKFDHLKYAIDKGFIVDKEFIDGHKYQKNLLVDLFHIYPDLCQYYDGNDDSVYLTAVKGGFAPGSVFFSNNLISLSTKSKVLKLQPYSIRYLQDYVKKYYYNYHGILGNYDFNFINNKLVISETNSYSENIDQLNLLKLYKEAIDNGLVINDELFIKYEELCNDSIFMAIAVSLDGNYYKYFKGDNVKIITKAVSRGYHLSIEEFDKYQNNQKFVMEVIKRFPDYYKYYRGYNSDVLLTAIKNGYTPLAKELLKFNYDDDIMSILIDKDPNYIFNYTGQSVQLLKKAIDVLGLSRCDDFLKLPSVCENDELMKILIKYNPYAIFSYRGYNVEELVKLTPFSKKIPWSELKYYSFDKKKFVKHFEDITNFLDKCNINANDFLQYQLGSSENWLNMMVKVIENNSLDDFLKVKNYFFKNYYNKNDNVIFNIDNFIDILTNYNKYPFFCSAVCDRDLGFEEKKMIKFLFGRNDSSFLNGEILSMGDLNDVKDALQDEYLMTMINIRKSYSSFEEIDSSGENMIRSFINTLLFNNTDIESLLDKYGDLERLKILKFNNRSNPKLSKLIGEVSIYTSIIQSVCECKDMEKLFNICISLMENFDLTLECSSYFYNYEEKMRKLFELDCIENLTRLSKVKNYDSYLDIEKTKKYGVDVLDFSDKKYILLGHVQSYRESIEDIVEGKSSGNKNFISLVVISYLKQNLYRDGIVFGYDHLTNDSFITSSIFNMNSNGYINHFSSKVDNIYNKQKGILETSNPSGYNNSELLAYRNGLKPSCIIIPLNREITDKEVDIARKYNLKIVITQEEYQTIINSSNIEIEKDDDNTLDVDNLDALTDLRDKILNTFKDENTKDLRKIAIFTDSHGLYEPTLAILEDCRRQGIEEIYSLGDNIGTGPNPEEVLDLLDEYGVQSLKGNHEIYVGDGIDGLAEHLFKTGAYREALNNSDWTRNHISQEHLDKIKLYPSMIDLTLGGKKLALVHSIRDYNSGERIIDVDSFDQVLQGHIHFESENDNVYTLRGAGIGGQDKNKAFYLILSEKEDGGYNIERRFVPFNKTNLESDIISSDLNDHDRRKISSWVSR